MNCPSRWIAAAAAAAAAPPPPSPLRASTELAGKPSFARGLFIGKLETSQVFPYPDVLSADAKETLGMLVEPVTKFFDEVRTSPFPLVL